MKLKKKKLNKDKICFKKRCNLTATPKILYFGTHGIFFVRTTRIELIYLVMLRRIIKKLRRPQKRKVFYHRKMWFWLRKNFPISRKSKNARMGKGKGKFLRWIIRVPRNYIILEFFGWHHTTLKYICYKINKKNNLQINWFTRLLEKPQIVFSKHKYSYLLTTKYNMGDRNL